MGKTRTRVLVAEDEEILRKLAADSIGSWGHDVTSVADGEAAWNILREPDAPQLLVIDWMMPKMNGIELCEKLRALSAPRFFYIILLTSKQDKNSLLTALEAGADDFLSKPFNAQELRAHLVAGERVINLENKLNERIRLLEKTVRERDQARDLLHESEKYRNLFEYANDAILIFDPTDETVINANDKACEMYGVERDEFIGSSIRTISQDVQRGAEQLKKLLTEGVYQEFETVHFRRDGTPLNLLINASLIEYEEQTAILSINRDITERRAVDRARIRAKKEWIETVDSIPEMILLENADGEVVRCNRAVTTFLGADYRQIIGRKLKDLFANGYARSFPGVDSPTSKLFRGAANEVQFPHHEDRWFEVINHPQKNETGDVSGWVHVIKDVTERRIAETALRRLNVAIAQAADSISITDANGIIQYVNPAFEQTTGWTLAEAQGRHFLSLQGKVVSETIYEDLAEHLAAGRVWSGNYPNRRKDGAVYEEETTISPVKDARDTVLNYVAVRRDVTERRRLESIAEAVNMMENVGYVFSGIRHELGNPINSIKTTLSVLRKNLERWTDGQTGEYINRALTEVTRVEYLLQSLKNFSLFENPKMQSVSLIGFMNSFLPVVESDFAKRGIAIIFFYDQPLKNCAVDPRALHQVLLNLLSNAADALEDVDAPQINVNLCAAKKRIELHVGDNGIGMTEEQQQNLFKPFYTSKVEGTGLGLVIIKKLISKMRATIEITSRLNVGTRVTLSFEVAEDE